MQQTGIIKKLYKEHDLNTALTCSAFDPDFLALDIYDTAFPFLLLFYLSVTSFLLFIGELLVISQTISKLQTLCSCKGKEGHHSDELSTLINTLPGQIILRKNKISGQQ